MKILAIETSCDETAMAIMEAKGGLKQPRFKVIQNLVASQIKIHRPFGGVVPNLAKREHIRNLPILFRKIQDSRFKIQDIDLIAVTVGPGLEPALWTGINFAEELLKKYKKSLAGTNHLEGHLYSFLLKSKILNLKSLFPAIALIVSGGHTILLKMTSLVKWKKIGETRDDAAGEAFDKVARLLKLSYPGGPEIERLALSLPKGEKTPIPFPRPMLNQKNFDFSFSGLKTAVLYYLRDKGYSHWGVVNSEKNKSLNSIPHTLVANVAASFQRAVIGVLTSKTVRAAKEFKAKSVILCGGVAMNQALRADLKLKIENLGLQFFVPELNHNTDNAAMISAAAYINCLKNKKYKIEANGGLGI